MALEPATGRLNTFQRTMLQWNELHPYHAVHLMRLEGSPDIHRLQNTIESCLQRRALIGLRVNSRAGTYSYDGDAIETVVRVVESGPDARNTLREEVQRQLNERFSIAERFSPFRFFILPEDCSFLLGMAYFHPTADAESVTLLMRDLATGYLTGRLPELTQALDRHPPRHDTLLKTPLALIARKLIEFPAAIWAMRHSHRPHLRNAEDLSNLFRLMPISTETLGRLVGTAKAWGVTLHDLMLAMLMKSLAPLAPDRYHEKRRPNIALGTIANVRKDLGIDSERTFGLFLGSFVVTHPVPEGIGLKQLAMDVRSQTRRIKNRKLYLAAHLELRIASWLISRYSTARRKKFYHKHHPLWGGITNMNINALWPEEATAKPLDYIRAVSTGPATPLVLSVTTFGNRMNIGFAYRPAVFSEEKIDRLQEEMRRQFDQLEDHS